MTNRELLVLTGADISRRAGRRRAIRVSAPCRAWARRHPQLLRAAFRHPDAEISFAKILADTPASDLLAMGFVEIEATRWDAYCGNAVDETRWSHRRGDDYGVRVILGLIDGRAEHDDAAQRGTTMLHALETHVR